MENLDLDEYGFPGKAFHYHGKIEQERKRGDKLLFLLKEKHKSPAIVKPNVLNALNLIDQNIIACVGVEEHPFIYAGKSDDEIQDIRANALEKWNDDEGILNGIGPLYFGQAVKLVRPNVPVQCVEDPALYQIAEEKYDEYLDKMEQLEAKYYKEMAVEKYGKDWNGIAAKETQPLVKASHSKALAAIEEEYGNDPANINRDAPFLANLLSLWDVVGFERAAILNGGSKHIVRLVPQLPVQVRFIQLTQE
jgi:hypothetical protein